MKVALVFMVSEGFLVRVGSRSMSDGASRVDESVMGKHFKFVLVVGGNTVEAWLLLVIAIIG